MTVEELTASGRPVTAFVRARDRKFIQIGLTDPAGEYGERPVEVILVTPTTALNLMSQLAQTLREDV